jgi:hypothetical protein
MQGSYLGFAVNANIGHAQVRDEQGFQHSFITWEGGMKIGYFSDFSLYAEFGVDLAELAFNDRSDDSKGSEYTQFQNENFDHRDVDNDIDGYLGMGSSLTIAPIKISAFIRLREIDGHRWQAQENTFAGVELAVVF